jgi:hypothetical protein
MRFKLQKSLLPIFRNFGFSRAVVLQFRRFSIGQINFIKITTQFYKHILTNIEKEKLDFDIVINTTQLLEKPFNKFDFWTESIIENGFGENLDHYVMRQKLTNKKTNT